MDTNPFSPDPINKYIIDYDEDLDVYFRNLARTYMHINYHNPWWIRIINSFVLLIENKFKSKIIYRWDEEKDSLFIGRERRRTARDDGSSPTMHFAMLIENLKNKGRHMMLPITKKIKLR